MHLFRVCLLRYLLVAPVLLAACSAQNSTSASPSSHEKVGWEPGPTQRGTLTLVWSCAATIITCTWSILHLNVPSRWDGFWIRLLRKVKWMCITVLFPEFIFAKAICELKDAVDDTYDMKMAESELHFEVVFGRVAQILHRVFHPLPSVETRKSRTKHRQGAWIDRPRNLPSTSLQDERWSQEWIKWTPVHSYFANMGGFELSNPNLFGSLPRITTPEVLARCQGLSSKQNLFPSKDDIEDKGKADLLVKLLALCQISFLVLSVVVRSLTHLSVSQLEIATIAFSAMAIITYVANLWKPKDVGIPIIVRLATEPNESSHDSRPSNPDNAAEMAEIERNLNSVSFWEYFIKPSSMEYELISNFDSDIKSLLIFDSIPNDRIRKQGGVSIASAVVAISTVAFGALHWIAWFFAFPSRAESMMWRIGSLVSAIVPCLALLGRFILSLPASRRLRPFYELIHAELEVLNRYPAAWWTSFNSRSSFRGEFECFLTTGIPVPVSTAPVPLGDSLVHLKSERLLEYNSMVSLDTDRAEWDLFSKDLESTYACWGASKTNPEYTLGLMSLAAVRRHNDWRPRVVAPSRTSSWPLYEAFVRNGLRAEGTSVPEASPFEVIREKRRRVLERWKEINRVLLWCDFFSRFITISAALLYAVARIALLIIAFTSLRSSPPEMYITSWTRFMPSIS